MILLDTNVLSEFMRVAPAQGVIAWLDAQPADKVWICSVTRAEIEVGIALLPEGRRKQGLKLKAEAWRSKMRLPSSMRASSRPERVSANRYPWKTPKSPRSP